MRLGRPTRDQLLAVVTEELAAGNYRSIAERVVSFVKNDSVLAQLVVPLLAAELSKVGDRNPGRFGRAQRRPPTRDEREKNLKELVFGMGVQFAFESLSKARDIVDGRLLANKVEAQRAEEHLAAARLGPNRVTRQQFRARLREFLVRRYKLPIEKVSELTRKKKGSF